MKLRSSAALVLVLAAALAAPAAAQGGAAEDTAAPAWTRRVTLGVNLNASTLRISPFPVGDNHRTGGGWGMTLGYGATDHVSLFLRGNVSYQHSQYDLGARYSFGSSLSRLRPYLEGALTHTLSADGGYRVRGPALTGGGGLEYFLSPRLSLDAGMSFTRGRFDPDGGVSERAGAGNDFRSGRFILGLKLRQ